MSFDELKKNIQDSSVPDRQVLKMFLSYKPPNADNVFEVLELLNEHRPAVIKLLIEGDRQKQKEKK